MYDCLLTLIGSTFTFPSRRSAQFSVLCQLLVTIDRNAKSICDPVVSANDLKDSYNLEKKPNLSLHCRLHGKDLSEI